MDLANYNIKYNAGELVSKVDLCNEYHEALMDISHEGQDMQIQIVITKNKDQFISGGNE